MRARRAEKDAAESKDASQEGETEVSTTKRKREDDGDEHNKKQPSVGGNMEEGEDDIKFRNYRPRTKDLKHMARENTKPEDIESQVKDIMETNALDPEDTELDVMNLAPRKPNWDLKRDLDKKLAKLQRRTDKAIKDLIRARIAREKQEPVAAAS